MELITDKAAMRAWSRTRKAQGKRIGFVPTMGSLHAGHLALVELAARHADEVVVSIYVNPTQFDRRDDFERYPRTVSADQSALSRTPCKAVFAPSDLYNPDHMSWVEVPALAAHLCGAYRPGHFRGVATIVTKFFSIVEPDVAVFGDKDYQQRRVIEHMVSDLDFPLTIIAGPTSREPDGLAMSSRNARLTPEWRAAAASIPRALFEARDRFLGGERRVGALRRPMLDAFATAGGIVDYVAVADDATLTPMVDDARVDRAAVIALAVFFGGVRLIDNVRIDPAQG